MGSSVALYLSLYLKGQATGLSPPRSSASSRGDPRALWGVLLGGVVPGVSCLVLIGFNYQLSALSLCPYHKAVSCLLYLCLEVTCILSCLGLKLVPYYFHFKLFQ